MQALIQEKLDHQVKLHVDHIKLQNNISELSEQIIAASEVCLNTSEASSLLLTCRLRPCNRVKRRGLQLKPEAMSSMQKYVSMYCNL